MRPSLPLLALALVLGPVVPAAASGLGYYRTPALHGERVYFTAEGDLWSAPLAGGQAARLTTHASEESRPAVSPDGRWIAFTAAYEGPQEAYVMPLEGGLPRRLSFEGGRSLVLGWTPAGEVLYSTHHVTGPRGQMVIAAVHPGTGTRRVFPALDANDACLDEVGLTLYFTRMGLQVTGDNARNYRGGATAELWRMDLGTEAEAQRLPLDAPATRPMWWKGRLYFLSDRDGVSNLWSSTGEGGELRQHTCHRDFEVRSPNLDQGRIVYQLGADLRMLDLGTGQDRILALELVSDFDQQRERALRNPVGFLESSTFAPKGDRVVFTCRGQVAVAGPEPLRRVELALPPGSRARQAVLSPDGKWVYAFCDASGENEIWRFPAEGGPGAIQLTRDAAGHRRRLLPSPDGARIAHTDKAGRLYLLDLASGENRRIDVSPHGEYEDLVWSPDGRMLALVRSATERLMGQILLHHVGTGRQEVLTRDKYEAGSPAFSPDGRWLYFLSDRSFRVVNRSPWGDRNLGPVFDRRTRLYALALQGGLRFPFRAPDELDGSGEASGKAEAGSRKVPEVQWENLAARLYEVPLPPGNYRDLQTDGKRLYFLESEPGPEPRPALKSLEIAPEAKAEVFAADVRDFALSADGRKVFLAKRTPGDFAIVEAGPKAVEGPRSAVKLADWTLLVSPRREWRQMFADAWRMHRDHLYDPAMRGVDWKGVRAKYEPLVERITDRAELDDLLAQMSAEVGALHSQIRPGDLRRAQDGSAPAFLGGVLERTAEGDRIARIYRTDPELPGEASPLAQPGLDIREGDVVTAVNGRPVGEARDISDLLRNQAGRPTLLELARGPVRRKVLVTPVDADRNAALRYGDWEESCRRTVEAASGGTIGYLHLRAMGTSDIESFAREFYANVHRGGLVLDVRRNNGGSIDSWIIEKLLRRAWAFWKPPAGTAYTNMQQSFRGHLVVLIDETTYSDGETFAAGIRSLGLAPLVGRRTAGAGVWLGDSNLLVDRGMARVAETPQYDARSGAWIIEGTGVAPDVEVVNPPRESFLGRDRQLETAIRILQEKLAREPLVPLQPGPIPPLGGPR